MLSHGRAIHPLRMGLVQRERLFLGDDAHLAVLRDEGELRVVVDEDHGWQP